MGYTQRELAEHAHLSLGAIRKVERGEHLPTHGVLQSIAGVLLISVEELSGQPYRERRSDEMVQHHRLHAVVRVYDLPTDWRTVRPLVEIAKDVDTAAAYRAAALTSNWIWSCLPASLRSCEGE